MKAFDRRLNKLEERFGVSKEERVVFVMSYVGKKLTLEEDRCLQILDECGSIRASGFTLVHLGRIPAGLNAWETERFLRQDGATVTGFPGAK